ncbi:MAG: hypothetical protein K0S74_1687 [Chlamydiales bacterium]|jgi:outer membrane protein assembly factor BamD (BamD/ComL family)|nr:hypothetical protein [Chlamydiales bacterium]
MKKSSFFILSSVFAFSILPTLSYADYQVKKDGTLVEDKYIATGTVQEHYSLMMKAVEQQNWVETAKQSRIIVENFPETPFAQESLYQLGVSQYYMEEFDQADKWLSSYLKNKLQTHLKYFEEAMQYKFEIAEQFRAGAKRRMFHAEKLPKWLSAESDAIQIYDEVIQVLPGHELAAKSLFAKGTLLAEIDRYSESVKAFETLIERFPRHDLTSEAYVAIAAVYAKQLKKEKDHPDLFSLAQLNYNKFRKNFPKEDRLTKVENYLKEMQETFAQGLYEIGAFYERKKQPHAATVYYKNVITDYPSSQVAQLCQERLQALQAVNNK